MLFLNEPRSIGIVTVLLVMACSSAPEGGGTADASVREIAVATPPHVSVSAPHEASEPDVQSGTDNRVSPLATLQDGKPSPRTPRREVPERALRGDRRCVEAEPWTLPMPAVERQHPALPFTAPGSISVGTVVDGTLVRGRELPLRGPHHAVLAEHAARGTHWGTDELVSGIQGAAGHVAATHPDAVMGVGNAARDGGGGLPWSISHKAGRDVDLSFYLVDGQGRDVLPDTLLQLSPPDGTVTWGGQELRFDVARNYLLLESLLLSDAVSIQYVFCADFLVKKLRAEAARRGAPGKIRKALETFVRQPRGTLPHDDHFHVRARCSPEDRLEGCRDIVDGREVVPDDETWRARVAAIEGLLGADDVRIRRDAAWALGLLRAVRSRDALEARLEDPQVMARRATFEALAVLWRHPPLKIVGELVRSSEDPVIVETGLRLLRRGGRQSRGLVEALLADPRVLPDPRRFSDGELVVRREAAEVAGWLADERLFLSLVALTADPDPGVRRAADWALRLTTNHAVRGVDGGEIVDGEGLAAAWTSWRRRAGSKRARWLRDGFEAAGVDVRRKTRPAARALLALIVSEEAHLSFNAQRVLADWCPGRGPGPGLQDRWWIRRKWKAGLERCFR
ncbi:MAG: hypothetical protein ABIK09_12535 [Pseudomonadota bacterium]